MKTIQYVWLLLLLLPVSVSVSAEYYRYVDKDGRVYFVDDMSKIPEEYQNDVQRYKLSEGSGSNHGPSEPIDHKASDTVQKAYQKDAPEKQSEKTDGETASKSALYKKKKELEDEYASLMTEKEALTESIREWSKRYKTRKRKSVARGKLNELKQQELAWQAKYKEWEKKKTALESRGKPFRLELN